MSRTEEKGNFFVHSPHRLYYQTLGSGPKVMLLFHGYGQDHRVFGKIISSLDQGYTLYAFDLFYHGRSSSPSTDPPITASEWANLIHRFLRMHQINRIDMLGYSMGGRFALSLVEHLSQSIDRVVLLDPDGIQSSRWYWFASTTRLGRMLLRRTVVRPQLLFMLIKIARKHSLVQSSMLKFAERHMRTRRHRYWVYRRWAGLRGIRPRLPRVIRQSNRQSILIEIYLGQYDRIIRRRAVVSFYKRLNNRRLYQLPCGHNALIQAVVAHLSTKQ